MFHDNSNPYITASTNAGALGQIEIIEKFLEMTHPQLVEGLADDE